ncbi:hypothetical protein F2P81_025583 [Scophthalmus maximus]|uniref:Uncharacterized protein n=1 Tax=Scophthalmus maximus TaxID=52904 RepID=A0A6A4RPQ5_SCOMX|nr:hypothetical protein F2P81_025583 [Scophthalmus maximus]
MEKAVKEYVRFCERDYDVDGDTVTEEVVSPSHSVLLLMLKRHRLTQPLFQSVPVDSEETQTNPAIDPDMRRTLRP